MNGDMSDDGLDAGVAAEWPDTPEAAMRGILDALRVIKGVAREHGFDGTLAKLDEAAAIVRLEGQPARGQG